MRLAPSKARTRPALRLLGLLRAVQQRHEDFPPELVARLLVWGRRLLGLDRNSEEDLQRLAHQVGAPIDLDHPDGALAARLALQLSLDHPDHPADPPSVAQAARHLSALRAALEHPVP